MPRPRRSVLRAGAATAATCLAGCVGIGGTTERVDVDLRNEGSAARELAVTVTFDRETLFERTATLDAGESAGGSFENPDDTGEARVDAAVDGDSRATESVRIGPGTGTMSITVTVSDDGVDVVPVRT